MAPRRDNLRQHSALKRASPICTQSHNGTARTPNRLRPRSHLLLTTPAMLLAPSRAAVLERALATGGSAALPSFLVPAFTLALLPRRTTTRTSTRTPPSARQQQQRRAFSATAGRASKLGRTPISIPPGVELTVGEPYAHQVPTSWLRVMRRTVTVAGPLGKLDLEVPAWLHVAHDAAERRAVLSIEDVKAKNQKEMWGTTWAYIQQYIAGVSEGHTAILRLVGVGYRASVEERPKKAQYPGQKFVCLKLGFTHPVEEAVPLGMKASTPQPTRILLEGINRQEVMQFAANIRGWRRPEPYKGKGIFVNDETIKLKQKKIK
ncbi:54S ribosomal protein L6 [Xylariaceae sp. FL0804]|nr:54S ribosomal protein L6 [Xylariaceae sp. FL0804]